MKKLVLVCSLATLAACGSEPISPLFDSDLAGAETGDGGTIAIPDVDPDVAPDVDPDVAPDVDPDVAPDVDPDAAPDVDPDVDPDVAPDVDPDVVPDVAPDVDPDADPDVEPDVAPDVIRPAGCGDGIVDDGEECDDGNEVNTDECNNECRISFCGDGISNSTLGQITLDDVLINAFGSEGYVCDDGASCGPTPAVCDVADNGSAAEHGICQALGYDLAISASWGDGPGGSISPMHHALNWECSEYVCVESPFSDFADNCSSFEMLAEITCEGIIGEQCDDGEANADAPDACRTTCLLPGCGDGITDAGEDCDDGDDNADAPDACRVACLLPACGDGIQDAPEGCDNGAGNADEPDTCRLSCALPACMDGIVDAGEECDDGNDISDDGCSNFCRIPGCRDGVLQDDEECDDGNDINEDGCSNECLLPQCGDGIFQDVLGEQCDDGNDDDFDGCSNECVAASCGDGVVQSEGPGCSLLLINDREEGVPELTALFDLEDIEYESADATAASDLERLNEHSFVIFNHNNRAATGAEVAALNAYVEGGGTLLITGYDSMGSPTDTALAGVARVTTSGDGPFSGECAVIAEGHPIMDGPYGSWPAGYAFTVTSTDHDNVSAGGESIEIASVSTASKITFAEGIGAGGTVMYWNSNNGLVDWIAAGADSQAIFLNLMAGYCRGLAEECDDGDLNADVMGATCRTDCSVPGCGDGVLDTDLDEECDDGNFTEADGCSNICLRPQCGDGVIQGDEGCDDGNAVDTDDCRNDCSPQVCGDSFLADAEDCDEGEFNADVPDSSCRTNCSVPTCGDAITDTGEECDDGNDIETDLCSSACASPVCGDGFVQPALGEECDDGNDIDTDDCRTDCTVHLCGDGFLADSEECDDGELNSEEPDATCRLDCFFSTCGDGVTDTGEECDDGNTNDRDLCLQTCVAASCGDGIRQALAGESCDDGNDIDDDECANDCTGDVTGFGSCADRDLGSATGEVSTGSTAGQGNDYTASCGGGSNGQDLSFNWVAPESGNYTITTNGSSYDTALAVRGFPEVVLTDECADSVELFCNDDGGVGTQSLINLAATGGTEYLIIVDGFSSSAGGAYVLTITGP
ncbi:MAG: cysteine-rich repeat protein [Bradymonadia bacterium]|jgi:cysteine-rich repeat protein